MQTDENYQHPIFGLTPKSVDSRFVFVLMPFHEKYQAIYDDIIKPVIEARSLKCYRADEYNNVNSIILDIWKSIRKSRLLIADLTEQRPNVMYELGLAHDMGKQVIIISQPGEGNSFPFDLLHLRRIEYQDSVKGAESLKKKLSATLDELLTSTEVKPIVQQTFPQKQKTPMEDENLKVFYVGQTIVSNQVTVRIADIQLSKDKTLAFLSIENNTDSDQTLDISKTYIQQDRTAIWLSGTTINSTIPPGIKEEGSLVFGPINLSRKATHIHIAFMFIGTFHFTVGLG